jgi:hypothetical protein
MEYIRVLVQQGTSEPQARWFSRKGYPVLLSVTINGEVSGKIGKILEVESGYLEVSVASIVGTKAETVAITIKPSSTSIRSPKEVIINVTEEKA